MQLYLYFVSDWWYSLHLVKKKTTKKNRCTLPLHSSKAAHNHNRRVSVSVMHSLFQQPKNRFLHSYTQCKVILITFVSSQQVNSDSYVHLYLYSNYYCYNKKTMHGCWTHMCIHTFMYSFVFPMFCSVQETCQQTSLGNIELLNAKSNPGLELASKLICSSRLIMTIWLSMAAFLILKNQT